ncbi:hypothetical protein [Mesobacillus selenatarsenatis]|uniref:DUF2157 domain-containing protein n=1 Tax=Mesobacillus selenatarsenatis (strain DSM 18680 / JCM 14380 / FERM P-15431 / SF-1) TaxID=1321606 RepID=A0A0A8X5I7_MESS1|nr:hypothetical protein [Mesobacillus selenatarsenatis]GAM15203.1 hypothetical protein SAMD00020551_3359 [Mesobacillus selenatarsenatis SF-1]
MDDHRKKIITNEIKYWKQNRLLPEHYCDFLLNLYTEGSSEDDSTRRNSRTKGILGLILIGLLSLSVFLFYFTELSLFLQTALIIFFGVISLLVAFYMLKKSFFDLIPLLASALLLLITSVQAAEIIFPDHPGMLYIVAGLNCLLWVTVGTRWKLVSFKISGIIGFLVLLITIFI